MTMKLSLLSRLRLNRVIKMSRFDPEANKQVKYGTEHLNKLTAATMTYDELSEWLDRKISSTRRMMIGAQRRANRDMITGCRAELSALTALKHTLYKWFKMCGGEVKDNEEH